MFAIALILGNAVSSPNETSALARVATNTADWQSGPLPSGVSKKEIDALVRRAMGPRSNRERVRSVLITIGSKLVYERYHPLDKSSSMLDTFSVSKSIVGTILGILIDDGRLQLDQPAPVPAWSDPSDPRSAISLRHLLQMSSGLDWSEEYSSPNSSVLEMTRAVSVSDYAASRPLKYKPGTKFNYSSGDTAILMRIIADNLGGTKKTKAFIKSRLLDPLGIGKVDYLQDPSGHIAGFMGINMTARDLARFGLLYLRDGKIGKKQILSREFVAFTRSPTTIFRGYAGHWWIMQGEQTARGLWGQYITISRSKNMVLVINSAREGNFQEQGAKATELWNSLYALFPSR
jgi:CubicO group peptidase (beta-lactamase class C family)